jgi:hypothetical protein
MATAAGGGASGALTGGEQSLRRHFQGSMPCGRTDSEGAWTVTWGICAVPGKEQAIIQNTFVQILIRDNVILLRKIASSICLRAASS